MKPGAGGFTELVAVIPCELIAALEAVMADNFMHGAAANSLLHLRGAEGVIQLAEPDLFSWAWIKVLIWSNRGGWRLAVLCLLITSSVW